MTRPRTTGPLGVALQGNEQASVDLVRNMDLQKPADHNRRVWDDRTGVGPSRVGLYPDDFPRAFSSLLVKTSATAYQITKFTGLDEGYLSRLRSGEKQNPSMETIVKICIALAHINSGFTLSDAERLLNSVGRSLKSRC